MLFLLLSENVYKYHISLKLGSIILVQYGFYEIQEKICPENRISSKLYIFRKKWIINEILAVSFYSPSDQMWAEYWQWSYLNGYLVIEISRTNT